MNKKVVIRLILWAVLSGLAITGVSLLDASQPKPDASGWCCLCMCGSKAQDKCSTYCIRRQNSKSIIEEPAIKECTRRCERKFHGTASH